MPSQYAAHKALGTVVASAAAALAVLPGVAVFRDGLYAPPGYEQVFGVIITITSTLALLLLTLYRHAIVDIERGRIVQITLVLCAIGLIALMGFAYLRARAVCPGPTADDPEIYVLIFRPEAVAAAAQQSEGVCRAVLAGPNAASILMEVRHSPGLVIISNAVFLSLYILMNIVTVAALSIAAWRVAGDTGRRCDATLPDLLSDPSAADSSEREQISVVRSPSNDRMQETQGHP